MNEHETIRKQLSDYRDLSPEKQKTLDLHLATCAECARYFQQLQTMDKNIATMTLAQTTYAARHYPSSIHNRQVAFGQAIEQTQTGWLEQWLRRRGHTAKQIGQLAGVAIVLFFAIGLSFVFGGTNLDELMLKPAATTASVITANQPVTITFGCRHTDCTWYKSKAEEFNKLYPGTQVVISQARTLDSLERIQQEGVGQTESMIRLAVGQYDTSEWFNSISNLPTNIMGMRNLQPFIQSDSDFEIADYYPAAKDFLSQPSVMTLPYNLAPALIVYDKQRLDAAGVNYPSVDWTLQDFYTITQRVSSNSAVECCPGFVNSARITALPNFDRATFALGDLEQYLRAQPAGNDPSAIVAKMEQDIQQYTHLVATGAIETSNLNAKASLWTKLLFGENLPGFPFSKEQFGFAPLPQELRSAIPPLPGNVYYIRKASQHANESWLWIKFLSRQNAPGNVGAPARRSLAEAHYLNRDEWSTSQSEVLRQILETDSVAWEKRWDTYGRMAGAINGAVQQVIDGKTVEEAFAPIHGQLEKEVQYWQQMCTEKRSCK